MLCNVVHSQSSRASKESRAVRLVIQVVIMSSSTIFVAIVTAAVLLACAAIASSQTVSSSTGTSASPVIVTLYFITDQTALPIECGYGNLICTGTASRYVCTGIVNGSSTLYNTDQIEDEVYPWLNLNTNCFGAVGDGILPLNDENVGITFDLGFECQILYKGSPYASFIEPSLGYDGPITVEFSANAAAVPTCPPAIVLPSFYNVSNFSFCILEFSEVDAPFYYSELIATTVGIMNVAEIPPSPGQNNGNIKYFVRSFTNATMTFNGSAPQAVEYLPPDIEPYGPNDNYIYLLSNNRGGFFAANNGAILAFTDYQGLVYGFVNDPDSYDSDFYLYQGSVEDENNNFYGAMIFVQPYNPATPTFVTCPATLSDAQQYVNPITVQLAVCLYTYNDFTSSTSWVNYVAAIVNATAYASFYGYRTYQVTGTIDGIYAENNGTGNGALKNVQTANINGGGNGGSEQWIYLPAAASTQALSTGAYLNVGANGDNIQVAIGFGVYCGNTCGQYGMLYAQPITVTSTTDLSAALTNATQLCQLPLATPPTSPPIVTGSGNICMFVEGVAGSSPWAATGTSGWVAIVQASVTYSIPNAINAYTDASLGSSFLTLTSVINGSISVYSPFVGSSGSQAVVSASLLVLSTGGAMSTSNTMPNGGATNAGVSGVSNAVYAGAAAAPLDTNGLGFILSSGIEFPGQSATQVSNVINVYFDIDPLTGVRYPRIRGFGASSKTISSLITDLLGVSTNFAASVPINSPSACQSALATSTHVIPQAVNAPSQPAITSVIQLNYTITDNLTYVARVILLMAVVQSGAVDVYGVTHAVVTVTGGSRFYGYGTPANNFSSSTSTSTINTGACLTANQYFYADSSQYPYIDASGIQYSVRPTQPLLGLPATTASRKSTSFTVYADPATSRLSEAPSATQSIPTSSTVTYAIM